MGEHYTFTETIKSMMGRDWGKDFGSQKDASKYMANDPKEVTAWALMCILQEIEGFKQALIREGVDKRIVALSEMVYDEFREFIDERESKHGPCPDDIKDYFRGVMYRDIGRLIVEYKRIPNWARCPGLDLPVKGTELRKQYDRWMKRRPQK